MPTLTFSASGNLFGSAASGYPQAASLGSGTAWYANPNADGQYLVLDAGSAGYITGVTTMGRGDLGMWVTSYALNYSVDGLSWTSLLPTVFAANVDNTHAVTNAVAVYARYVMIVAVSHYNWVSMRAGLTFGGTMCAAGFYSSAIGATSSSACGACAAGTFSTASGASACQACAAGAYSTAVGSAAAACPGGLCGAGLYSTTLAASSSASCLACAAGSYSSAAGLGGACPSLCGAGLYSTTTAATSSATCLACAGAREACG